MHLTQNSGNEPFCPSVVSTWCRQKSHMTTSKRRHPLHSTKLNRTMRWAHKRVTADMSNYAFELDFKERITSHNSSASVVDCKRKAISHKRLFVSLTFFFSRKTMNKESWNKLLYKFRNWNHHSTDIIIHYSQEGVLISYTSHSTSKSSPPNLHCPRRDNNFSSQGIRAWS